MDKDLVKLVQLDKGLFYKKNIKKLDEGFTLLLKPSPLKVQFKLVKHIFIYLFN